MRHHDSNKEFRTSFGRGGAGNLRRVSEAQHAHNLLLQMRRNSADVDPADIARATPGHHFHMHHSNSSNYQQTRRKSGSISSSMPSMSNLFESLKRRVSSASSLSSMGTSPSYSGSSTRPRQHLHDSLGDEPALGREVSSTASTGGRGSCGDDEDAPARRVAEEDEDEDDVDGGIGGGPQMAVRRKAGVVGSSSSNHEAVAGPSASH